MNMDAMQQAAARANQGAAQQQGAIQALMAQVTGSICAGVLGAEFSHAKHQAMEKGAMFPGGEDEDGEPKAQPFQINIGEPVEVSFAAAQMIMAKAGLIRLQKPPEEPQGG